MLLTSVLYTAIQGARGPGVFFVIPCVDIYEKIDLRVQNFDVPPQEVRLYLAPQPLAMINEKPYQLVTNLYISDINKR